MVYPKPYSVYLRGTIYMHMYVYTSGDLYAHVHRVCGLRFRVDKVLVWCRGWASGFRVQFLLLSGPWTFFFSL